MTAQERIRSLRLLEKQQKHPQYAARIGIRVRMVKQDPKKMEEKKCLN